MMISRTTATAMLMAVLLVTGCGESSVELPVVSGAQPQSGGVVRIAHDSPTQMDPALADDAYEATITNQLFSGLLEWDSDLNMLPGLAYDWTISRDGLVYEFQIREGARFHNGREITADDFVYSFTRLMDPRRVEPTIIQDYLLHVEGARAVMAGEAETLSGLEILEPHRLRIRLSEPYPSFLSVLCMDQAKVVPREAIEDPDLDFARYPVGSGPFCLERWDADAVTISRNRDYFGRPAWLDSVVFVNYPDSLIGSIKDDFFAGRLDAREIRERDVRELGSRGQYLRIRRPELSLEILGFNVNTPPFDDQRIRKAVSMSVDRESMHEMAGSDFVTPVGLLPPGMPGYTPESKVWEENLDEAGRILAELGYGEDNPLRFVIYTASHSEYAQRRDSTLTAGLARAHIVPEIRHVDWEELDRRITDLTADSFFIIWVADLPDPDSFLFTLFEGEGLYNMFGYRNPEVDVLLAAGQNETDVGARFDLYRRAERLILEDAPCVPLFNFTVNFAFQPYVRGVDMSPIGLSGIPMHKLWLDRSDSREAVHAGF